MKSELKILKICHGSEVELPGKKRTFLITARNVEKRYDIETF